MNSKNTTTVDVTKIYLSRIQPNKFRLIWKFKIHTGFNANPLHFALFPSMHRLRNDEKFLVKLVNPHQKSGWFSFSNHVSIFLRTLFGTRDKHIFKLQSWYGFVEMWTAVWNRMGDLLAGEISIFWCLYFDVLESNILNEAKKLCVLKIHSCHTRIIYTFNLKINFWTRVLWPVS